MTIYLATVGLILAVVGLDSHPGMCLFGVLLTLLAVGLHAWEPRVYREDRRGGYLPDDTFERIVDRSYTAGERARLDRVSRRRRTQA